MTKPILQISNLAVERNESRILRDVSLTVPRGSSVGIVGETGSGKSMTCRAVTGMLRRIGAQVTHGTVEYDDVDLLNASDSEWQALRRHGIGFVPQASIGGLDPVVRIGRQLSETVRLTHRSSEQRDRVRELMDCVRLPSDDTFLRRYPHELSGGQRQRVMIALGLAGRPCLLLADEPTTALDVTVQRGILNLLGELRRELSMSLLLVSHDLSVILAVCEYIVVMYGGMTVESGLTSAILAAPAHPYTRALVASHPTAAHEGRRLLGIPGMPPEPTSGDIGCPFAPRCPQAVSYCSDRPLELTLIGSEHRAACHRIEELAS